MATQIPSVGRVVHYVAYGNPNSSGARYLTCRAAIITEVIPAVRIDMVEGKDRAIDNGYDVSLNVMYPTGYFFQQHVSYNEDKKPNTWHWPEYVPAKEE